MLWDVIGCVLWSGLLGSSHFIEMLLISVELVRLSWMRSLKGLFKRKQSSVEFSRVSLVY